MAFYVRIAKLSEGAEHARYSFSPDDKSFGEISIDKASGEVTLDKAIELPQADKIAMSAMVRLRKVWRDGSLPERTVFAS